ncbi:MAG: hypothetical protein N3A70_13140 [Anoxybacillus gonensis]|nr:hypothetical protein [Anoxybacillus gonensis]
MKNARVLTEGAVQLAIFTVLLLLSLYMPVFGMVATFFFSNSISFIYDAPYI